MGGFLEEYFLHVKSLSLLVILAHMRICCHVHLLLPVSGNNSCVYQFLL